MKLTEPDTRDRLLAYVSLVRTAVAANPKTSVSAICTVAGVGRRSALHLRELGIVSDLPDSAGTKWESRATDAEIVDMLIEHRRKQEQPPAGPGMSASVLDMERKFGVVAEEHGRLSDRVAALENADPKAAELAADDRELLNLALTDRKELATRLDECERILGNLLRVEAGRGAKPDAAPPAVVQKKWRVLVLGVFARDHRHVYDSVEAQLKGTALAVKVEFASPEDRRPVSTSGIDAIFYTQEADSRVRDSLRNCLVPMHRAAGGNKVVADAIVSFLRGVKS